MIHSDDFSVFYNSYDFYYSFPITFLVGLSPLLDQKFINFYQPIIFIQFGNNFDDYFYN